MTEYYAVIVVESEDTFVVYQSGKIDVRVPNPKLVAHKIIEVK